MNETLLFIITAVTVFVISMAEARTDYWVIQLKNEVEQFSVLWRVDLETRWKLWGNAVMFAGIATFAGLAALLTEQWPYLFWIPPFWLLWWIVHDCSLGYWLNDDIFHVGSGKVDQWFLAIAIGNEKVYLGVKLFLLGLATWNYFIFN